MKFYIVLAFLLQQMLSFAAGELPYTYTNAIYDDYVKTVTMEVNNLPTNFPVLRLNSSDYIMLKFDDLLNEERNLYYKIIHCDKDWQPSRLRDIEYISGFNDERLRNYSYSINTRVQYLHYWQQFPNANTKLKVSGNYLVVIYEDSMEFPLLSRRFIVSESQVNTTMTAIYPGDVENIRFKQEISVNIDFEKFKMRNPVSEITLVMLQNEDWHTSRQSNPSFFSGTNLRFNRLRTFDFWALSEYREFDTRSLFRLGRGVHFIERNKTYTDVLLNLDEPWRNKVYLFNFDFNGKFIIDNFERLTGKLADVALNEYTTSVTNDSSLRQSQRDSIISSITVDNNFGITTVAEERNIRSDYTNVIFALEDEISLANGEDIYVLGAMNNWTPTEEFRMKFDDARQIYSTTVELKQGYYNYNYGVVDNEGNIDYHIMQGSWSDTENEYQSIVYYRGLGDIYDRIISFQSFNTSTQAFLR